MKPNLAEGVAATRVAGLETASKPLHALGRRSVREGLGGDGPAGHLLQAVVPDRCSRGDGLVDVTNLEQAASVGAVGPNPGVAVGLELELDRQALRAFLFTA